MLPSSRTPEGDPVECPTCGANSTVNASEPPGDSVCPVCGAHLWLGSRRNDTCGIKLTIREFVSELTTLVATKDSTVYTARFLVSGLKHSLSARGAILWTARPKLFLPWRRIPVLECYAGISDRPAFAAELLSSGHEVVRHVDTGNDSFLLLGVPLLAGRKVTGAIEILQRDVESESVRKGYMRFLTQVAQIASPLTA